MSIAANRIVATNVRRYRTARNWTMEHLGQLLDPPMVKQGIWELEHTAESGKRAFPVDLLLSLAIALQVTPNELLGVNKDAEGFTSGYEAGWSAAVSEMKARLADLQRSGLNSGGED